MCFSLVVHIPLFYIKVLNIGFRFLSRPCKFWKYFFIQGRYVVGPCHHGMAHPQVVDGGTASDMDGSCEYIE